MEINKFKVFTWDRVLLYILPPVLLVVAGIFSLVHGTTPAIGYLVLAITVVGWSLCSSVEFVLRNKFKKAIVGYTTDGTAAIPMFFTSPPTTQLLRDISLAEIEVMNFWCGKLTKPISLFMNYFNGGACLFVNKPIDLNNHGPTGGLALSTVSNFAVGTTSGNYCCIEYSGQISDWQRALDCVKHEAGHKCLNAAGYDQDSNTQHALMKQYGFGY